MLRIHLLLLLLLFCACRTKYDTSKAVAILEESQVMPDYRLRQEATQFDTTDRIASIKEYKPTPVQNVSNNPNEVAYKNGFLYAVSNKNLGALNLQNNAFSEVTHDIKNAKVTPVENIVLIFNTLGNFAFIDISKHAIIWDGTIETNSLASAFTCISNASSCYTLTVDGEIVILDYQNFTKRVDKMFHKSDIVLNEIYTPLVIDDKIVFAVGQSEFAIFDTSRLTTIAQSTFAEENSSLFDINLVQGLYKGGESVIISHINGSYAFNILYGRPLWVKRFVFNHAFVASNYTIFYEEGTKKLTSLHLNTGEVKWLQDFPSSPIDIYVNYKKEVVVITGDGIHLFDLETGEKIDFKTVNMHDTDYTFVHDHQLYYTSKGKVYKIQ